MKNFTFKKLSLIIFLTITLNAILAKDSFSIQDTLRFNPEADNTLYEDSQGAYSNGQGQYFFTGKTASGFIRRGLVRFGLLEFIPPCATVISASLKMYMSKTISGNQDIQLRKLYEYWGEGSSQAFGEEGFGAPSEPYDATWIHTFYPDQYWSRDGGYFSDSSSATTSVGGLGYYTWNSTRMKQDIQEWVNDPQSNKGWLIMGNESANTTAKRFDSRNNDSLSRHPVLTIIFETGNTIPLYVQSLIEGFWYGTYMIRDTMRVYLRNSVSPYAIVDSGKCFLDEYGGGRICFEHAPTGLYYIMLNHRNSIDTWSALPVPLTVGSSDYYEFTSSASQAFGANEVFKLGSYCIYSGDVNKDGFVDLTDTQLIDNDAFDFVSGYVRTDVNGDDFVDVSDATIADNNSFNYVSVVSP